PTHMPCRVHSAESSPARYLNGPGPPESDRRRGLGQGEEGDMIRQLTSGEREGAAAILVALAVAGLAMAILGRGDPLAIHGAIVMVFAVALLGPVLSAFYEPEPSPERLTRYYDDPIKAGIVLTMAWGVFG